MKACDTGMPCLWSIPIMATALALCSCTHPAKPAMPVPAAPLNPPEIAQIGYGAQADFVQCTPPLCPTRTPKTIGAASRGQALQASPAVEPDLSLDAMGSAATTAPALPERQTWSVPFAFGSAQLGATARAVLRQVIPELPDDGRITIAGRTDSSGPAAVNDALAAARAKAVHDYLVRARPDLAAAMTAEGRGNCCFAAPNDTAAGRAQNRRVEITLKALAPPP